MNRYEKAYENHTMRKKSLTLTWTQKLSDHLNLAHAARKNIKNEETKTKNASAHLVEYRFKIREESLEGIPE